MNMCRMEFRDEARMFQGKRFQIFPHFELLLAVEVVEQMMKVDLCHLSEQRKETGHVLPLEERKLHIKCW